MQEIDGKGGARATKARSSSLPAQGRGSNSGARTRELRRIDAENQKLLRRLRSTKASVSVSQLEEEHRAKRGLVRLRCEHQPALPELEAPPPRTLLAAGRSASVTGLEGAPQGELDGVPLGSGQCGAGVGAGAAGSG